MTRIEVPDDVEYPHDVVRLVKALAVAGWHATPLEAARLWEDYSDMYAAGWLVLPESDADLVDLVGVQASIYETVGE